MSPTLATMEERVVTIHESIGEAYQKYSNAIGIVGLMQFLMENPLHPHPWGSSHCIQQNFQFSAFNHPFPTSVKLHHRMVCN
jgi:hypothetical protein